MQRASLSRALTTKQRGVVLTHLPTRIICKAINTFENIFPFQKIRYKCNIVLFVKMYIFSSYFFVFATKKYIFYFIKTMDICTSQSIGVTDLPVS